MAAGATICYAAAHLTACGDGATGIAADAVPSSTAHFRLQVQNGEPGQSVQNLSLIGGAEEPRFSITLPAGSTALKFQATGGAIVQLSDDPSFTKSNSRNICVSATTCQWAFEPIAQPRTIYVLLGTRSSYSGVTLNTYVGPSPSKVVPLNLGESMNGLSGPVARGQDVYFTPRLAAGARALTATMTNGNGNGELVLTTSLADFSGMYADPPT